MDSLNTIVLTGRPGSGKGTQGKLLAERRGWMHFSTGELFKKMRDDGTPLGNKVKEIFDAGNLLPDWFATYLFEHAVLNMSAEAGIVCEGYPRSVAQAKEFEAILAWLGRPYKVVELEVSDDEVTARMLKRATEEHRPDSASEEQIRTRLAVYHENTAPVLGYFKERGTFVSVDGSGSVEDIAKSIDEVLA